MYSPLNEAISKEISILHSHFKGSFVYGISSRDLFKISIRNRYFVHYFRPYRFAPKLIPLVERKFDISHIYHNLHNRFFLDNLSKKPIILTAAAGGDVLDIGEYDKIDKIVVESNSEKDRLSKAGIHEDKIKIVYPGLNLDKFYYQKPSGKFKILFASSPFEKGYFGPRGINLLLSVSEQIKETMFILLWRKWSGTIAPIKDLVSDKVNIKLYLKTIQDINSFIGEVHAVIAPFTSRQLTKPCPHSIIEGLAAGKPVLVSRETGIADLIEQEKCGVVFKPTEEETLKAISELKKNYKIYQTNARQCAEKYFSAHKFIQNYKTIYNEALNQR